MNKLISLIVPVYNSEKYLTKCLDSLIDQVYENIEIVIVDDGSTDSSRTICEKYCRNNDRIKYYYQENSGLVAARKNGIKKATGEWIGFVDSDDWIEPSMYYDLAKIMSDNNCDMVSSGMIRDYENGKPSKVVSDNYDEGLYIDLEKDIYSNMLYNFRTKNRGLSCTLVGKILKKSLLTEVYKDMNDKIYYGEDAVIYVYCLLCDRIFIDKRYYYHYNIREKSMCTSVNPDMLENNHNLYSYLFKWMNSSKIREVLLLQLRRFMIDLEIHKLNIMYGINTAAFLNWDIDLDEKVWDSRMAIYGAGDCGQAIYNTMIAKGINKNLVVWVDSYPAGKDKFCMYSIKEPSFLSENEFDYLIIAIENNDIARQVANICELQYGVPRSKIIFGKFKKNSSFI